MPPDDPVMLSRPSLSDIPIQSPSVEKIEKVEKPEKTEKPEKPEKPERPEKAAKTEKSKKGDDTHKKEKPEKEKKERSHKKKKDSSTPAEDSPIGSSRETQVTRVCLLFTYPSFLDFENIDYCSRKGLL